MQIVRAYLRTSTQNQAEAGTIAVQRNEIEKYAKKHGLTITHYYEDDGVSGSEENRPALLRMLSDMKKDKGISQVCLCYSASRLARELRLQEIIIHNLVQMQVELVSITEPDLLRGDATSNLLRQIIGATSEYEKRVIVARLHAGRKYKAERGGFAGGNPGLGYKVSGGALVIDEKAADAVRLIRKLRRSSTKKWSYAKIADELNTRGYTTSKGRPFTLQGVRGVLNAKRNRGVMKYGESSVYVSDLKIKAI